MRGPHASTRDQSAHSLKLWHLLKEVNRMGTRALKDRNCMTLFFRENSHVLTVAVAQEFFWSCALAMRFSMATVHFPSAFGSDCAHWLYLCIYYFNQYFYYLQCLCEVTTVKSYRWFDITAWWYVVLEFGGARVRTPSASLCKRVLASDGWLFPLVSISGPRVAYIAISFRSVSLCAFVPILEHSYISWVSCSCAGGPQYETQHVGGWIVVGWCNSGTRWAIMIRNRRPWLRTKKVSIIQKW